MITVLRHILAPILTLSLPDIAAAAPTPNDVPEAEDMLNSLQQPIDLRDVDAFIQTANGLDMRVDYHIAHGHVIIAVRLDEDGTGVTRLTLNQRVLVAQELVGGEVIAEGTAFGALTEQEAHLLAASVYQVWDHDLAFKVPVDTEGLLCSVAAGLSTLTIAAGVFSGCELATATTGTAACIGLGVQIGAATGAIVHDKCTGAQN
ncbi:hypothetical protein [Nannocystis pusilla]|uniref:Uncharacterized protein n=1 Tax=Nannocystis pusilla TaxID=889268 RepID=A0ABS7TPN5_9BACT|nr:hypothetical protein [Nannocystis pusilla]MBZ5710190.1 hypothetical protein [Nannocystis pusilla]